MLCVHVYKSVCMELVLYMYITAHRDKIITLHNHSRLKLFSYTNTLPSPYVANIKSYQYLVRNAETLT